MIWQDIMVDRKLTYEELTSGLASAFSINAEKIAVVENVEMLPPAGEKNLAAVVYDLPHGEFVQQFSLFAFGSLENEPVKETVARLACNIGCRCLISTDDSLDPYLEHFS